MARDRHVLLFWRNDIAIAPLRFKQAALRLLQVPRPVLEQPRLAYAWTRGAEPGLCAKLFGIPVRHRCYVAIEGDVNHLILAW